MLVSEHPPQATIQHAVSLNSSAAGLTTSIGADSVTRLVVPCAFRRLLLERGIRIMLHHEYKLFSVPRA